MIKNLVIIVTLLFFWNTKNTFSNVKSDFEKANALYSQNKFKEAKEVYLEIATQNYRSAELYFNIGNCLYKLDSLEGAILYFERAKKLKPNDEDINLNLQIANGKIVDKIEPIPQLFIATYWIEFISFFATYIWAIISIIISFVSVSFFLFYYFAKNPLSKRVFFFSGIFFFLLMIFMLIVTHSSNNYFSAKDNSRAVIYEDVVNIMSAPNESSMNLFSLHIGTTVQVKEVDGDWLKIKINNGNEGWIKKIKVRII
ncbi:MAG: tetratricopeptide repeat protein [Bacteroidota bacterium]